MLVRSRCHRHLRVLDPVEELARLRALPAHPGAARRLAEVPAWDGKLRFVSKKGGYRDVTSEFAHEQAVLRLILGAIRPDHPSGNDGVPRTVLEDLINEGLALGLLQLSW